MSREAMADRLQHLIGLREHICRAFDFCRVCFASMTNVQLPDGQIISGTSPVIIIGPNGSGKTRDSRKITSDTHVEFVNALRFNILNTQIPRSSLGEARMMENNVKEGLRGNYFNTQDDISPILGRLMAESDDAARRFMLSAQRGESPKPPPPTKFQQLQALWAEVFPGRSIDISPEDLQLRTTTGISGSAAAYASNMMSDGEKAAFYLAGRIFSAATDRLLVVDEPETHMHSMLAVNLWNALEDARPDLRIVYVTHDLTFALSRRDATVVLASPVDGFRIVTLDEAPSRVVTESLLGAASLSFYATRVVFCEGTNTSFDYQLYNAWFRDRATVVRAVADCQTVIQCVEALRKSSIAVSLEAIGIVDRDHSPENFLESLPDGIQPLSFHEVESLFCLQGIVSAAGEHLDREIDVKGYEEAIRSSVTEAMINKIALDRWKRRLEPLLERLLAKSVSRTSSLQDTRTAVSRIFDYTTWDFSPEDALDEEEKRLRGALSSANFEEVLRLFPGKHFLTVASNFTGLGRGDYVHLVTSALTKMDGNLKNLGAAAESALLPYLPART
jgi:ABC-type dipeptide/oligopeptide/nickel transport system ATPase subunit